MPRDSEGEFDVSTSHPCFISVKKYDIHIKPKSYKFKLLGGLFNMVSEFGLARGPGFEPLLCNLNV